MEQVDDTRVWASQWYRVTPRSFVHEELFFDPDAVLRVFAGESYKSLLLRKDGREKRAQEVGDAYRTLPADRLRSDDDVTAIERTELKKLTLTGGSLLRKPRLTVETADRTYTYYHHRRRHDVSSLGKQLKAQYPALSVQVDSDA